MAPYERMSLQTLIRLTQQKESMIRQLQSDIKRIEVTISKGVKDHEQLNQRV